MRSSTSSSEPKFRAAHRKAVRSLLLLIAVLLAGLELAARILVEPGSKVLRTMTEEYAAAVRLRRSPGKKTLLIVGNSLVGQGIDMDALSSRLPTDWEARRFWIFNTGYTDWRFGLDRLFAEGSRPDVVAVVFPALHLCGRGVRGEFFAQYLMRAGDILEVRRETGLDRTAAASLLFGRFSKFFALRAEIRKAVLMRLVMPDLPRMNALIVGSPQGAHLDDTYVVDKASERLLDCRRIAETHGSRLVLLVPPIPRPGEEHHAALREAARRAGVAAVIPMSYSDVPPSDFSDDIHLTPGGASLFTRRLAADLRPWLEQNGSSTASSVRGADPLATR